MEKHVLYKMQLTEEELETLKEIVEYAVKQKRADLLHLFNVTYGSNKTELSKASATLLRFKKFLYKLNDTPF